MPRPGVLPVLQVPNAAIPKVGEIGGMRLLDLPHTSAARLVHFQEEGHPNPLRSP
ncbi:MAG: hypothetical protein ACRDH6_07435 [Actinomycetota bacterium]